MMETEYLIFETFELSINLKFSGNENFQRLKLH